MYSSISNIIDGIRLINSKIDQISNSTEAQARAAEQVSDSMNLISAATQETTLNILEISSGIDSQVSTFEEIGATAQDMREMAEKLQTLVKSFKLEG